MRKVLGIVLFQVLFTLGVAYWSSISPEFGLLARHWATFVLGLLLYLFSMLVLFLCNLGRVVPTNYVLLGIFTIGETMIVSGATA